MTMLLPSTWRYTFPLEVNIDSAAAVSFGGVPHAVSTTTMHAALFARLRFMFVGHTVAKGSLSQPIVVAHKCMITVDYCLGSRHAIEPRAPQLERAAFRGNARSGAAPR